MAGREATDAIIRGRCAISVNNPGHPLPPGWKRVALLDISALGTGHTPSRNFSQYWDGDIPWIGIRDAGAHHGGIINDTIQHVTDLGLANSAARLLPRSTICLSRTASVGYVVKMGREMATSQDFVTWTCSEALDPDFLLKALLAEGDDIRKFGEGSTHTTIYFPEVKAFHIDLPPVAEQRRIVTKIDSLSAKSKRARDHLDRIPKLVGKLKSNLINTLCSNNGIVYSVEDLSSNQRYSLSIGPFGSNLVKSDYRQAGVPLVFVRNIRERKFDDARAVFVEREKALQLKAHTVNPGDLLITKMGDPPGDVAIYPLDRPAGIITSDCIKLTPRAALASSEYLYYAMQTEDFQKQIRDITKGVAQQKVSLENFRKLHLHVPTLEEQDKICRTLQTMLANVEKLSAQAADARKLIYSLDQAMLSKAFRGELVPQDPDDEPASVLLERIKAERAGAVPARRGRGRPRLATAI